jgi:hypothetical protein
MRRPADIGPVPPPEPDRSQAPYAVRIRLFPEEYAKLCAASQKAGLRVSDWAVRELLRGAK